MNEPGAWKDLFNLVGPWGTVTVAMGLFFWRLLVWLRPLGERIATSHLGLIASLQENDKKQTDSLLTLQSTLATAAVTAAKVAAESAWSAAAAHQKTHEKLDIIERKIDKAK